MVSTFLTRVYVPVLYSLLEDLQQAVRRAWSGGSAAVTSSTDR